MKKEALKGTKVMLFLEDSALGNGTVCLSTGLTLNYTVAMVAPQTKDDGEYQVPDEDGDRWDVTNDSQSDIDLDTAKKLLQDYNNNTSVKLKIAQAANYNKEGLDATAEGRWIADPNGPSISGEGFISNINLEGSVGSKASVSCTWTGRSCHRRQHALRRTG